MQVRLFSDSQQYSHRVRFVMALKKVSAKVDYVTGKSKELLDINSQGTLPTLEDRDVRLTESQVIIEYLDERYPYPQLMPGFPVQRAECRQQMYWIQKDLCAHSRRNSRGLWSAGKQDAQRAGEQGAPRVADKSHDIDAAF